MNYFVTSLHATLAQKVAKLSGNLKDTFLNENAKEKDQVKSNDKLYKMALFVFRICLPKNVKKWNFAHKCKISKIFRKRNIC